MLSAFFANETDQNGHKEGLLNDVKSQVKKLMEEAVVRSYVHEENTIITTLCASVEAILVHGLRQSIFTFFDDNYTLALCRRIAKVCPPAQHVLDRLDYHRNAMHLPSKQPNRSQVLWEAAMLSALNGPATKTKTLTRNGSTRSIGQSNGADGNRGPGPGNRNRGVARATSMRSSPASNDPKLKTLWIRVALLEKVLDKIILYLASNASRYYEKYAIMMDPCDGMLMADLLRGPCAVDYSRTRTTDYLYSDPPVAELIQRHGISGSLRSRQLPYVPPSCQTNTDRDIRSISIRSLPSVHTPDDVALRLDCPVSDYSCPTPPARSIESLLNSRTSSVTSVPQATESSWTTECEPSVTSYSGASSSRLSRRKLVLAAKEHVESMHQSVRSTLVYGKNNVLMQTTDSAKELPGYLSLHDYGSEMGLVLKWTPNWAMAPTLPSEHGQQDDQEVGSTKTREAVRDANMSESGRYAYWRYALKLKVSDLVYIHCHQLNDTYQIVFVRKDGVQFPPMTFYAKSHLPAFLNCLEQSLEGQGGFLDPQLHDSAPKQTARNVSESVSTNQDLIHATENPANSQVASAPQSEPSGTSEKSSEPQANASIDSSTRRPFMFNRSFLERLLSGNMAPPSPSESSTIPDGSTNPDSIEQSEEFHTYRVVCSDPARGEVPQHSLVERCATLQNAVSCDIAEENEDNIDEDSFEQSCEGIGQTILSEAFHRWLSRCRKLRVLRSRLAGAVTPRLLTLDSPTNAANGVDQQLWEQLREGTDMQFTFLELCRHVYFGNCDMSLRRQIWPFLLGVYPWNADADELDRLAQSNERFYQTALSEWQSAQYLVKDPDKPDSTPHSSNTRIPNACDTHGSNDPAQTNGSLASINGRHDSDTGSTPLLKRGESSNSIQSNSAPEPLTAIPRNSTASDLRTPTAVSEDHLTPAAARASRFEFTELEDSEQTNEHLQPRVMLSPDSGTSIDLESEQAIGPELPEEIPYPEEVIEALGINLYRIDKDVSRCDRNHHFFANPKKDLNSDDLKLANLEPDFSELNENLIKLRNVICTWVWLHLDVGYIQGMCDLLAPLLVVLEDEGLTYACFCRLMDWMLPNFPVAKPTSAPSSNQSPSAPCDSTDSAVTAEKPTQTPIRPTLLSLARQYTAASTPISPVPSNDSTNLMDDCGASDAERSTSGINSPLQPINVYTVPSPYTVALSLPAANCMDLRFVNLKALIEVFDPEMFKFLCEKSMDSQFYFCYRWLLLDFKREFKYEDVFAIWEVIWASRRLVSYDFGVFFALALLQYYRDIILYYDMDVTEIIRFYNELTEQHHATALLDLARSFVFQMQNILHES